MATGRRAGTGRQPAVTNTYSAGSVPVPDGPARPVKVRPTTVKEKATAAAASLYGRRARVRRAGFEAAGGRPGRADVLPDTPVGHGMSLADFGAQGMMAHGMSAAHTLDAVRGTSMMADPAHIGTAHAGSGEKVPRTIVQGTPDINAPHQTAEHVIPGRRWEDLHPTEQKKALDRVRQYGTTVEKMKNDLRDQVLSAHARAGRNGFATPYSSRFYEGPSLQHEKIEQGADEVMAHPRAQQLGITREHARAMVVVANAATSPRAKFQVGDRFVNHEGAMHALKSALDGVDPKTAGATKPQGLAVFKGNIAKATHLTSQMLEGKHAGEVTLPSGKLAFDPKEAPKTTDYNGAWTDPTGPDSRYVSDVHSTHSLMPHLSTSKSIVHEMPDGSTVALHPHDKVPKGAVPKMAQQKHPETGELLTNPDGSPKMKVVTAGSESEDYLAGNKVGLSALHDHIARQVATELGLSHSVHNAGATHFLQATDWGEEQINRPDQPNSERLAYGGDPRIAARGHDIEMRTPAGGETVGTPRPPHPGHGPFEMTRYGDSPSATRSEHFRAAALAPAQFSQHTSDEEDRPWDIGQQKRAEAIQKKRQRQGRGLVVDPEAREQGW